MEEETQRIKNVLKPQLERSLQNSLDGHAVSVLGAIRPPSEQLKQSWLWFASPQPFVTVSAAIEDVCHWDEYVKLVIKQHLDDIRIEAIFDTKLLRQAASDGNVPPVILELDDKKMLHIKYNMDVMLQQKGEDLNKPFPIREQLLSAFSLTIRSKYKEMEKEMKEKRVVGLESALIGLGIDVSVELEMPTAQIERTVPEDKVKNVYEWWSSPLDIDMGPYSPVIEAFKRLLSEESTAKTLKNINKVVLSHSWNSQDTSLVTVSLSNGLLSIAYNATVLVGPPAVRCPLEPHFNTVLGLKYRKLVDTIHSKRTPELQESLSEDDRWGPDAITVSIDTVSVNNTVDSDHLGDAFQWMMSRVPYQAITEALDKIMLRDVEAREVVLKKMSSLTVHGVWDNHSEDNATAELLSAGDMHVTFNIPVMIATQLASPVRARTRSRSVIQAPILESKLRVALGLQYRKYEREIVSKRTPEAHEEMSKFFGETLNSTMIDLESLRGLDAAVQQRAFQWWSSPKPVGVLHRVFVKLFKDPKTKTTVVAAVNAVTLSGASLSVKGEGARVSLIDSSLNITYNMTWLADDETAATAGAEGDIETGIMTAVGLAARKYERIIETRRLPALRTALSACVWKHDEVPEIALPDLEDEIGTYPEDMKQPAFMFWVSASPYDAVASALDRVARNGLDKLALGVITEQVHKITFRSKWNESTVQVVRAIIDENDLTIELNLHPILTSDSEEIAIDAEPEIRIAGGLKYQRYIWDIEHKQLLDIRHELSAESMFGKMGVQIDVDMDLDHVPEWRREEAFMWLSSNRPYSSISHGIAALCRTQLHKIAARKTIKAIKIATYWDESEEAEEDVRINMTDETLEVSFSLTRLLPSGGTDIATLLVQVLGLEHAVFAKEIRDVKLPGLQTALESSFMWGDSPVDVLMDLAEMEKGVPPDSLHAVHMWWASLRPWKAIQECFDTIFRDATSKKIVLDAVKELAIHSEWKADQAVSVTAEGIGEPIVVEEAEEQPIPSIEVPSISVDVPSVPTIEVPTIEVPSISIPVPSIEVPGEEEKVEEKEEEKEDKWVSVDHPTFKTYKLHFTFSLSDLLPNLAPSDLRPLVIQALDLDRLRLIELVTSRLLPDLKRDLGASDLVHDQSKQPLEVDVDLDDIQKSAPEDHLRDVQLFWSGTKPYSVFLDAIKRIFADSASKDAVLNTVDEVILGSKWIDGAAAVDIVQDGVVMHIVFNIPELKDEDFVKLHKTILDVLGLEYVKYANWINTVRVPELEKDLRAPKYFGPGDGAKGPITVGVAAGDIRESVPNDKWSEGYKYWGSNAPYKPLFDALEQIFAHASSRKVVVDMVDRINLLTVWDPDEGSPEHKVGMRDGTLSILFNLYRLLPNKATDLHPQMVKSLGLEHFKLQEVVRDNRIPDLVKSLARDRVVHHDVTVEGPENMKKVPKARSKEAWLWWSSPAPWEAVANAMQELCTKDVDRIVVQTSLKGVKFHSVWKPGEEEDEDEPVHVPKAPVKIAKSLLGMALTVTPQQMRWSTYRPALERNKKTKRSSSLEGGGLEEEAIAAHRAAAANAASTSNKCQVIMSKGILDVFFPVYEVLESEVSLDLVKPVFSAMGLDSRQFIADVREALPKLRAELHSEHIFGGKLTVAFDVEEITLDVPVDQRRDVCQYWASEQPYDCIADAFRRLCDATEDVQVALRKTVDHLVLHSVWGIETAGLEDEEIAEMEHDDIVVVRYDHEILDEKRPDVKVKTVRIIFIMERLLSSGITRPDILPLVCDALDLGFAHYVKTIEHKRVPSALSRLTNVLGGAGPQMEFDATTVNKGPDAGQVKAAWQWWVTETPYEAIVHAIDNAKRDTEVRRILVRRLKMLIITTSWTNETHVTYGDGNMVINMAVGVSDIDTAVIDAFGKWRKFALQIGQHVDKASSAIGVQVTFDKEGIPLDDTQVWEWWALDVPWEASTKELVAYVGQNVRVQEKWAREVESITMRHIAEATDDDTYLTCLLEQDFHRLVISFDPIKCLQLTDPIHFGPSVPDAMGYVPSADPITDIGEAARRTARNEKEKSDIIRTVQEILAYPNLFFPQSEEHIQAIEACKRVSTNPHEFIKGYVVKKVDEKNKEDGRVLLVTETGLHTMRFGKKAKDRRFVELKDFKSIFQGFYIGHKHKKMENDEDSPSYTLHLTLNRVERSGMFGKRQYERCYRPDVPSNLIGRKAIVREMSWVIYAVARANGVACDPPHELT